MVERASGQALQVADRIEGIPERPDVLEPLLERQLVSVLLVDLLPGAIRRTLSVDEEPVEVEEEPADDQGVSEVAGRTSMWTCWPLSCV
jgi:hypothetical protein